MNHGRPPKVKRVNDTQKSFVIMCGVLSTFALFVPTVLPFCAILWLALAMSWSKL